MKSLLPYILFLSMLPISAFAQSLPVGTPGLEDYYRRAQLMGKVDSSLSFCANPFFPVSALREKDPFNPSTLNSPLSTLNSHFSSSHLPTLSSSIRPLAPSSQSSSSLSVSPSLRPSVILLPITWQNQYNTHHPYSINDGPMIPARGYQSLLSAGFFAKLGPLSLQFYPEYVYAGNKDFETFTNFSHSDQATSAYNGFHAGIDLPEYFPEKPYNRLFPGQSSILLTVGPISAGLSSENLRWGPGSRNSLLMSNSASGFYHLTLNTVKPIRTPIGSFEFQLIGGKLETSNFLGKDANGNDRYYPETDDWRYLNAMVFTYQPRWIPGLFFGVNRSFMLMNEDAKKYNNYLPIFSRITKKKVSGLGEVGYAEDQQFSVFARWIFPADHAEIYAEYGRGDHNYDLLDMYLQPDHFRAYLVGFKKLFYLDASTGKYFEFNLEFTQLEQNKTNTHRAASYYAVYGGPLRGNTNLGQMLGAGIGPGSNLQTLSLSRGKGLDKVGIQVERYVHNNDLYYQFSNDNRGHWVDINLALLGEHTWKNLLFSAKLAYIRSYNYEYSYTTPPGGTNNYWTPGTDAYNLQGNVAVMYRF